MKNEYVYFREEEKTIILVYASRRRRSRSRRSSRRTDTCTSTSHLNSRCTLVLVTYLYSSSFVLLSPYFAVSMSTSLSKLYLLMHGICNGLVPYRTVPYRTVLVISPEIGTYV